jgi:MarR family transcriptional regulator, organic hydroperoxide resistance regulator
MARAETKPARAMPAEIEGGDRAGGAPASLLPGASVGYLVRETHRAFSRSLQARIGPHGVNVGMWFFLRALWEKDGISQRELSQRVRMMEPTTVTALRNMEKRGIVRRVRNTADRRVINVYLTPYGRELERTLLPQAATVNGIAGQGVTAAEVETLRTILSKIRGNLDGDEAVSGG